jgi:hypothetical protein
MNKKDDQIPACVGLPQRCVNILSWAMALFNEKETGTARQDLSDLLTLNMVLPQELFNNVFQPYQFPYSQV